MIDNLEKIKPLLIFKEDWTYHLQVIQRAKDNPDNFMKNHRVIKHYYIRSLDYLEKKYPEMIKLAELYNARVMINLNPKSNTKVTVKCISLLANYLEKGSPEAAYKVYSSAIGKTKSENKTWIIDWDGDFDMHHKTCLNDIIDKAEPMGQKIIEYIPSKNGMHIITKPFDLRNMQKEYPELDVQKNNPTNLLII